MDRYTKLQKIGQGSFGCAYLAVKKSDPSCRKYVIKEIRMDPRDQQTALREAKLLAALDHPNIIGCRESFLASANVLCIVTEFADGGDLRKQLTDRTTKRSPYKESDLLDLFIQSCLALKHLHDRKIIHRDIKPENIFLTSSHVVKLGDFGVATVLSHTLACAQTLTGTPYYTSPEICLGKKYNSKTDIWSLGCVLYELATFSHAFNGRSQRQLFENIISGSVAPIQGYSPRLVALVSEMLQKNPRDRPSVNQIIRKPIIMDKIQSFLSQRAMADELNHTVLHGQHIFQKKLAAPAQSGNNHDVASPVQKRAAGRVEPVGAKPVPSPVDPRVRAAQYMAPRSNKKKPASASPMPAGVGRRNSLKSSGSKKKIIKKVPAASPSPRKPRPKREAFPVPPPPPSVVKRPSPSLSEMQQRLLQRKKEVVARAREDAEKRKANIRRPVVVASPPVVRSTAVAKCEKPTPMPTPSVAKKDPVDAKLKVPPPPVSNRISVFMAQWQAQREQILNNIGSASPPPPPPFALGPPPPPVSAVPVKKPQQPPASAVPLTATGIVLKRGKTPISAVAVAAAKQRDAMKRDIQERKKAAAAQKGKGPASAANAGPLDDPVILVQNLPDYKPSRPAPPPPPAIPPPPPPTAVGNKQKEEQEEEEEDDVPTPDSTIVENANVEFQRMLLHLQSVVDGPVDDDDDDDDDEEVADGAVTPFNDTTLDTTTPLSPFVSLPLSLLQDPSFKDALRCQLRGSAVTETPRPHDEALSWLAQYIQDVL